VPGPAYGGLDTLTRILARAADGQTSPFERARLLAVFSQQFDRVLVGGVGAGQPARQLLHKLLQVLCAERDRVLHDEVLPALAAKGVAILPWGELAGAEHARLRALFRDTIYPLVTPLAVDSTHPFPGISPMSLHVAAFVRDHKGARERFACVPIRDALFGFGPFRNGFVRVDAERFVSVDAVVSACLDDLFHGVQVIERSTFRLGPAGVPRTGRDAAHLRSSWPRLEVEDTTTARLGEILRRNLDVADEAVYRTRAPLGLTERIMAIHGATGRGRP